MAGLTNKLAKLFCGNAVSSPSQVIAQFGSLAAGTPNFSSDPDVIQALDAWLNGWASANIIVGSQPVPPMQDLNAALYALSYQIAYLKSRGIPEWLSTQTYNLDDFCKVGAVQYVSQADNNTGNNPATDTGVNWSPYIETIAGPSLCKAWATFNGVSGSLLQAYNISNLTQSSSGIYTVTFTNPIGLNPSFNGNCSGIVRPRTQTTSGGFTTSQTFDTAGLNSGAFNPVQYPYVSIQFFSN